MRQDRLSERQTGFIKSAREFLIKIPILTIAILIGFSQAMAAPTQYYVDVTSVMPIRENITRDVKFGDFNNDGYADMIQTIKGQSRLFINDSAGRLGDATRSLFPDFSFDAMDAVFGDVNGDGWLDIYLSVRKGQNRIFINNVGAGFSDETTTRFNTTITDDTIGVALCDVDSDGDLDALSANFGQDQLWLNDGAGVFQITTGRLPVENTQQQDVECGDVDGDGDVDLFLASINGMLGAQDVLLINDGSGTFDYANGVTQGVPSLINYSNESTFFDAEGDGDLDIIVAVSGDSNAGGQDALLINNGNGLFSNGTSRLRAINDITLDIAVADVDGVNGPDLLFINRDGTEPSHLLLNDGFGNFQTLGNFPSISAPYQNGDFGDIDADGDLDAVVVGGYTALLQDRVFTNSGNGSFVDATFASRIPLINDNTMDSDMADLDLDGDADVVVGDRYANNHIYFSDGISGFYDVTATNLPSVVDDTISVELGDCSGDGYPDIFFGNHGTSRLLKNRGISGPGIFDELPVPVSLMDGFYAAEGAFGDLDGDGDKDLIVVKYQGGMLGAQNLYLENQGNCSFIDKTAERLPSLNDFSTKVTLSDIDGDNDLDIIVANLGGNNLGEQNRILINDGFGFFTDESVARIGAVNDTTKDIDVGDIDNDGDPDLLVVNEGQALKLYINDYNNGIGTGRFTEETGSRLPVVIEANQEADFADVDNDGDLDIVVVGGFSKEVQNRLLVNDGMGFFTDQTSTRMPYDSDMSRDAEFGDIDFDGDLDMVISNNGQNKIYVNVIIVPPTCTDADGDTYYSGSNPACVPNGDCNDNNPNVYPGSGEGDTYPGTCSDSLDNNCNGQVDYADPACSCPDSDGDFYQSAVCNSSPITGGDCNDGNLSINPGVGENCSNGTDDNCDGSVDGADPLCFCNDGDGDGYEAASCNTDPGSGGGDCNDNNTSIYPGATEDISNPSTCSDGFDNDCDGTIDANDTGCLCQDNDQDGYLDASCPLGGGTDCDDTSALINPGAAEICNDSLDNNCDGLTDRQDVSACPCPDLDLDGWQDSACNNQPQNSGGDCNDGNNAVNPGATEICNNLIDDDCDGSFDSDDSQCGEIIATVKLEPEVLEVGHKGRPVSAQVTLPAPYDVANINSSTVQICYDDSNSCVYGTDPSTSGGNIFNIKFARRDVEAISPEGEAIPFKVKGQMITGETFFGYDTIEVKKSSSGE